MVGSDCPHEAVALERITSGVPGLDEVLGGGFVRGAIALVMGLPGTGKTTLANQLCFAQAAQGGRAVYVTLLAEPSGGMLRNLETMAFFSRQAVNAGVFYVGGYKALRDEGLTGLLRLLHRIIRDERATFLVLDGLSSARSLSGSDIALKEFIVELQSLGAMTNCTTLLLANLRAEDANDPEHTMVDGLLELRLERGDRTHRTLEVIKLRGSDHLLGAHEYQISSAGCRVYPNAEAWLARRSDATPAFVVPTVSTGVEGLDAMVGGGLARSSTAMFLGFAGSGKTSVALHFLDAGAQQGESGLFVGFHEGESALLAAADTLGLRLRQAVGAGRVRLQWQLPHTQGLDAFAWQLLAAVEEHKVQRLVLDGFDGLRRAARPEGRTLRFAAALLEELRRRGVTTVVTEETEHAFGPEVGVRTPGSASLMDTVVLFEHLEVGVELRRLVSILKQRGRSSEWTCRELTFTAQGVQVAPSADSAATIVGRTSAELSGRRNRSPVR